MMPPIRMEEAFALFDAYNQQDPNLFTWEGMDYPAELFFALRLHQWVCTLEPNASEALLLASRCQHIGRWQIPRSSFPLGKPGYYNWRTTLARFHADTAGELLAKAGYTEDEIIPVRQIILKEKLRSNYDVQVMENALCLVFLQFQYEDFLKQHDEPTMLRILRKTWGKMTPAGHEAALGLQYSDSGKNLIGLALGS